MTAAQLLARIDAEADVLLERLACGEMRDMAEAKYRCKLLQQLRSEPPTPRPTGWPIDTLRQNLR